MAADTQEVRPPQFPAQLWTSASEASVTVRLAGSVNTPKPARPAEYPAEYPARLADVAPEVITLTVANGATSALLASGSREVDLAWSSRVGRYEQHCGVQTGRGSARRWRLTPLGPAILLQRRRYVRVPARLDVIVELGGVTMPGTTIEISEGGFRLQLPACVAASGRPATLHLVIGNRPIALEGRIVRARRTGPMETVTEVVIAFVATGAAAEAVRGLVLHRQLRNRAMRGH